jgi:hypothetical protein
MRNHFGSQQITSKNKHLKLPLTLNPLFLGDLVGHILLDTHSNNCYLIRFKPRIKRRFFGRAVTLPNHLNLRGLK